MSSVPWLALQEPSAAQSVSWYVYLGFLVFVIAMLFVDLRFFHTHAHEPTAKESGAWVAVWVALALAFGVVVYFWRGLSSALDYFTGYLIEYSLSVDNIFVFVIIFSYFGIPRQYQHRVLFYGILGAIIFRGIFIALGIVLIERFEWILYVFGAFLLFTAVRVARGSEETPHDQNPVLKFFQRNFRTTNQLHGQKLFTIEEGRRVATPLFIVLLVVETTDILFALDSIPAIFGITLDPFIVLTSNVFAILGLRAVYFLLARVLTRLHLLKYGLGVILAFVGLKMLLSRVWEPESWVSLGVIVIVLAVTALASVWFPPRPPEAIVQEPLQIDE
jgi:tellurite resistance protein TerC